MLPAENSGSQASRKKQLFLGAVVLVCDFISGFGVGEGGSPLYVHINFYFFSSSMKKISPTEGDDF